MNKISEQNNEADIYCVCELDNDNKIRCIVIIIVWTMAFSSCS